MKFGISNEHFEILERLVLSPLRMRGCEVYIFGSRTSSSHHPYADVDLLYCKNEDLPLGFISQIKESIEDSNFPYQVDLVDEAALAQSYRESVERSKQKLY